MRGDILIFRSTWTASAVEFRAAHVGEKGSIIRLCAAGISPAAQSSQCSRLVGGFAFLPGGVNEEGDWTMDKIGLRQVLPDVFADNPPVGSEIWRRDVTFDKGRVYLVEAASGSGKSSFCGYLYGYRRDYSGTILFDDRDIRELSVGEWSGLRCRSLAMMFQGLRLFPELSAVDNVRLKNNLTGRRSEAEIAWLFEALGIAEKRETSVSKLSFGQQQRVAFIRMLCQPADFMLLDEPMSHLDERNAAVMAGILLEEVRTNGTGVIVTSVGKRFEIEYDKVFSL